jgi:hypothetical protein
MALYCLEKTWTFSRKSGRWTLSKFITGTIKKVNVEERKRRSRVLGNEETVMGHKVLWIGERRANRHCVCWEKIGLFSN